MDIEKDILNLLKKSVRETEGPDILKKIAFENLDIPREKRFGDFSTSLALIFAQKTGRSAQEIARSIQQALDRELRHSNLRQQIDKIEVKGAGFINFFLSKACLYKTLQEIRRKGANFGRVKLGKGKKVHMEFVSANPTGPLNVAHGRQAAFGDSLANLLQFSGYKVTREYYLNDEGVQIDILGESLRAKYLGLLGIPCELPQEGYKGRYIDELAGDLVRRYGRRFVYSAFDFSRFACRQILKKIKEDLNAFGVNYDYWFSQKTLNKTGKIVKVLGILRKKGFLYQKESAWWLATSKFGDDKDRVVIKSDSNLTYIAPDIAYHRSKFKRGFSKMINIWGPDHHGYILRIKAAVSALGYDAQCLAILIVQLVSLSKADKVIPMSTRSGQYISLHDIIRAVGKDVARFFFLMRKRDSHLHFDLELAKKESLENPVYYIQYAHARILNVSKYAKGSAKPKIAFGENSDPSLLNKPEELSLIQTLRKFPSVVESCTLNLEPHRITTYLHDLAKEFHHYYERHRVVMQDVKLRSARLFLIDAVRIVLNNGLRLLAISAPEKM